MLSAEASGQCGLVRYIDECLSTTTLLFLPVPPSIKMTISVFSEQSAVLRSAVDGISRQLLVMAMACVGVCKSMTSMASGVGGSSGQWASTSSNISGLLASVLMVAFSLSRKSRQKCSKSAVSVRISEVEREVLFKSSKGD